MPYLIVTTTKEDFYNTQYEFPSFFCLTRHSDFVLSYLFFPAIFLCSLGVFMLFIIVFTFQMVMKGKSQKKLIVHCIWYNIYIVLHYNHVQNVSVQLTL